MQNARSRVSGSGCRNLEYAPNDWKTLEMKTPTRPTRKQMDYLVKFMLKYSNMSRGSRPVSNRVWDQLCARLNAFPGGTVRDLEKWKKSWIDYKYVMRRKHQNQSVADRIRDDAAEKELGNFNAEPTDSTLWQSEEQYLADQDTDEPNLTVPSTDSHQTESTSVAGNSTAIAVCDFLQMDDELIEDIKVEPYSDPLASIVNGNSTSQSSRSILNKKSPKNIVETAIRPQREPLKKKKEEKAKKTRVDAIQGQLLHTLKKNTLKRERNELLKQQNALLQKMHDSTEAYRKEIVAHNRDMREMKRRKLAFILGEDEN